MLSEAKSMLPPYSISSLSPEKATSGAKADWTLPKLPCLRFSYEKKTNRKGIE